jgi:Tfp pilus assembly protein PilZ
MLQPIEVLAGPRSALRRAVDIQCDVVSDFWDEPLAHKAVNLSPQGIWLETDYPLHVGTEVVLSFEPPRAERRVLVYGDVRRVAFKRRASEKKGAGMAISFDYLSRRDTTMLEELLRGLPPPIPPRRRPRVPSRRMRAPEPRTEMVWVDMLLTYEEDLGDRVNTVEISEHVACAPEENFNFAPMGELLTGSRRPYTWQA